MKTMKDEKIEVAKQYFYTANEEVSYCSDNGCGCEGYWYAKNVFNANGGFVCGELHSWEYKKDDLPKPFDDVDEFISYVENHGTFKDEE